jgi:hypothetical protein
MKKIYLFIYRITYVVTAYRSCSETNAQRLSDEIKRTLIEIKSSFMISNL